MHTLILRIVAFIFVVFALNTSIFSQNQLAFPGAEGYGKFTKGGRGGQVYEVTNLNDSGEGSLRAAVAESGPRTVVFRVSGTIELQSDLRINNPFITIVGQTAPGDGVCIKGNLSIDTDEVIIRFIRVRFDPSTGESDAIFGRYNKNIILDHISASWSTDEVFSVYHNEHVTIQWCMITEACPKSDSDSHRFGGIWGNDYSTYHHNLIAHNNSRNPRWASGAGHNDYRNNVLYNWGYQSCYGGEKQQPGNPDFDFTTVNMIANYYKPGPATECGVRDRIVEPSARSSDDKGSWYVAGNYVEGSPEVTKENWKGVDGSDYIKLADPWDAMPIDQQTPEDAYQSVIDHAGCSFPTRDAIDERIIEEVRTGTAAYGDNGIIDSPGEVGGWPELQSAPAAADSDHDGMPNDWEKNHDLNPSDANDRNRVASDGYTMLEKYLASIVDVPMEKK
ncbi:MAG: pectate lyase [Candidatus Marinimicrobia bacterium]|nr:pectate lyase [Candidatus Neomarinimicrobiota bacterium]